MLADSILSCIRRLAVLASLTYRYAIWQKEKLPKGENGRAQKRVLLISLNSNYFVVTTILVLIFGFFFSTSRPISGYLSSPGAMSIVAGYYVLSRALEIFVAFLDDAIQKLNGDDPGSTLKYGERLKLAFVSYIELMLGFGLVYYVAPCGWVHDSDGAHEFKSIIEAIYFSGATMTTVGYGDISPYVWQSQMIVIFQVLCTLILALVSFTVYTTLALEERKKSYDRPR